MIIGYDKNGNELRMGDICNFKIDNKESEGMIVYSNIDFAYEFEMLDDTFPSVYMHRVDTGTIEKVVNVWSTNINDFKYEGYRKLVVK